MKSSKYKREYTLTQHTPLLHFQGGQRGVTLRASEVKPQLDRFLHNFIEKMMLKVPQSWYIARESKYVHSFAYKMSVSSKTTQQVSKGKGSTVRQLYFADKSGTEALFFKSTCADGREFYGVHLTLVCFCEEMCLLEDANIPGLPGNVTLLDLIDFVLPAFFALHCFGTRATKGFGSFTLDDRPIDESYLRIFVPVYYSLAYKKENPCYTDVLTIIWIISGMMKSGFNFPHLNPPKYYKGRIFYYFIKKGIGSDKAFIKQKVLQGKDNNVNSEENARYSGFRFSRAMLGLPQEYQFRGGPKTSRCGKVKVKRVEGKNKIERFASPVRFIPNGQALFIVPTPIPDEMFGASFLFDKEQISTPSKDEFNLVQYLDWFMDELMDAVKNNGEKTIPSFDCVLKTLDTSFKNIRHPAKDRGPAHA